MRPIKFRAYHTCDKKIYDVAEIDFKKELIRLIINIDKFENLEIHLFAINEVELIQFTGLLDKNGKEIYEGNIVEFDFNSKRIRKQIGWAKIGFWFIGFGDREFATLDSRNPEVIGNIYENPELLKEKK